MSNNPLIPNRNESSQGFPEHELPFESVRELLDSLSTEQSRNQELISSIGFSLRSFTNLDLFLELIPVIAHSASRKICKTRYLI